jgi:energy-coupling factor transporter ATP-binding protein EcfA2
VTTAAAYDETTLPLWSDNPATADLLGFVDVARPIASAIRRERLNPVSVGLVGPWGSGKSTVLNLVANALEGDEKVIVVLTSPWAYDPNLDVKATLIGDVLEAIRARADQEGGTAATIKGRLSELAGKVRWSKAFALAAKTAITVQVPDWDAIEGLFKLDGDGAGSERDPTLSGFKEEFEKVLGDFTTVERVVVLVDDLDRCLPEAVIATLEAIKLFLSVPKMSFVIAYDRAPVVEAVRTRYEKAKDGDAMAEQYLEKIIQVPVGVPQLGEDEVTTYLAVTMLEPLISPADLGVIVSNAAARRVVGDRPLLDGHGVALTGAARDRVALAQRLAPVVFLPFKGNPRRVKRFLNDYWIRSSIAGARGAGLEPDALAKLVVLEQVHPTLFAELVGWAAEGIVKEKLDAIEGGALDGIEQWATPDARAWATLEPPLADLDLRPYLELAASLLAIPFSATGLPADLEAILEQLSDRSLAIRRNGQVAAKELDAEQRVLLGTTVIRMVGRFPERQANLAEAIPNIVGESEAVGLAIVDEIAKIDPPIVEASLVIRLASCDVPSVKTFVEAIKANPAYDDATVTLKTPPTTA